MHIAPLTWDGVLLFLGGAILQGIAWLIFWAKQSQKLDDFIGHVGELLGVHKERFNAIESRLADHDKALLAQAGSRAAAGR